MSGNSIKCFSDVLLKVLFVGLFEFVPSNVFVECSGRNPCCERLVGNVFVECSGRNPCCVRLVSNVFVECSGRNPCCASNTALCQSKRDIRVDYV